MPLEDKTKL